MSASVLFNNALTHLVNYYHSPALNDLEALLFFAHYIKYLGPLKPLVAKLVPSPRVQRARKAANDIDHESKVILAAKRAGLEAGDKDVTLEFTEKKDVMSILRMYLLPSHQNFRKY